jgi:hypothetical protein
MDKLTSLLDWTCVSEEFSGFELFRKLDFFKGPKDPKTIVSEYVEITTASREDEARKGGTLPLMRPSETIRPRILRPICDYVSLIARVSDFVCDKVRNGDHEHDLSIVQVRTRFELETRPIKLLFIIDADSEGADSFGRLLRAVERVVLEEERFTAELGHLNQRDQSMDYKSIFLEYPFIRVDEERS